MGVPEATVAMVHDELEALTVADLRQTALASAVEESSPPTIHRAPPTEVDLGKHLHFIRRQGGHGCWAFAWFAVWDIMNEMACPFSPNLAVGFDLWFHRNREVWEKQQGAHTCDGRWLNYSPSPFAAFGGGNKQSWVYANFGCPTEGSHITSYPLTTWSWKTIASSYEGANEAANYRWKGEPVTIFRMKDAKLSDQFVKLIAVGKPIRICIDRKSGQGHFQALVGYDLATKTFKYVESSGDRAHGDGFGTYTFDQVDGTLNSNETISHGEIIAIHPPRPVPAARIKVTHQDRGNLNLWLSISDSPQPKRQIWPPLQAEDHNAGTWAGRWVPWSDNSRDLHYTVRLPSELVWPPSDQSRVVLDLYDSGATAESGGVVEEFTVAFGSEIMPCSTITQGPATFQPRSHLRITVP